MARGDRIGWMPLFSFSIFPWGWGWALVDLVFIRRTRGRWCGLVWVASAVVCVGGGILDTYVWLYPIPYLALKCAIYVGHY
jgi:hypothetical protein